MPPPPSGAPGTGFGREKPPPKMPWDHLQIAQHPKASWKDVPCAVLDMLIQLPALPQAVLLFDKVGQDLLNIDLS